MFKKTASTTQEKLSVEQLQEELDKLRLKYDALQRENSLQMLSRSDMSQLQNDKSNLGRLVNELTVENNELKKKNQKLSDQNKELKDELDEARTTIDRLSGKPMIYEYKIEEIFENQRRKTLFNNYSEKDLFGLMDLRGPWCDEKGNPIPNKEEFPGPGPDWEWVEDWKVDLQSEKGQTDEEGWEYAFNFIGAGWHEKSAANTYVRRRRWIRSKRKALDPDQVPLVRSDSFYNLSKEGSTTPNSNGSSTPVNLRLSKEV